MSYDSVPERTLVPNKRMPGAQVATIVVIVNSDALLRNLKVAHFHDCARS